MLQAQTVDSHSALLRVSLQTGLPLALLRRPETLSAQELEQGEDSVRRILGVDEPPPASRRA